MYKQNCQIVENRNIAPGHWVLTLRSAEIARHAKPGQFVQLLCADGSLDPLLGRPFSFLDVAAGHFSILYQVVGKGTELLSKAGKGESLRVLGPLGNGFASHKPLSTVILVGGGVGIPPLYHLAKFWIKNHAVKKENIHVFLGARNKSLLLCEKDFQKLGVKVRVATDDGSKGQKGFITPTVAQYFSQSTDRGAVRLAGSTPRIYACGPTPMLKAVSVLSVQFKIPSEVSVEVPMACGFGACLGCAIKVKADAGHRFAIACTEGPVFQGSEILWD